MSLPSSSAPRTPPCASPRPSASVVACFPRFAALLATTAAALALALPAQAAEPPAAPLELKFGQFFQQPVGPRGLALSDTLRAADGRQVTLVGYMVAQEMARPGRFWLTPRPVRLSEHADGEADDLPPSAVTVLLDDAQQARVVAHRDGLVVLTGTLAVGRAEDPSGRVSWVRLQLPPQALEQAGLSAAPRDSRHGHAHAGHAH